MNSRSAGPAVQLHNVSKTYVQRRGDPVEAIRGVAFEVRRAEFLAIVGASGSGKSTLLKLISGTEKPTEGSIGFAGKRRPRLGFVFQSNVLIPWRTVARNLEFPMELHGVPREHRADMTNSVLSSVGLDLSLAAKFPDELSGGQARRVALAMALSNSAEVLLLDEPTSQLDFNTKRQIQDLIGSLATNGHLTTVLVTHDLEEALLLADRVLVLRDGSLVDVLDVAVPRPRTRHVLREPHMSEAIALLLKSIESQ